MNQSLPQKEKLLHEEKTRVILQAFYHVYNKLGYGFLERIYENALAHELSKRGFTVAQQLAIDVYYDGLVMGQYFADLVVDNCVILELKAADQINPQHTAQLLNYLKATDIEVGLLLNFGPEPQFRRKAFANERKIHPTKNPR
jgi:GxxExxY protein